MKTDYENQINELEEKIIQLKKVIRRVTNLSDEEIDKRATGFAIKRSETTTISPNMAAEISDISMGMKLMRDFLTNPNND